MSDVPKPDAAFNEWKFHYETLLEMTREHRRIWIVRASILAFALGVLANEALHRI